MKGALQGKREVKNLAKIPCEYFDRAQGLIFVDEVEAFFDEKAYEGCNAAKIELFFIAFAADEIYSQSTYKSLQ